MTLGRSLLSALVFLPSSARAQPAGAALDRAQAQIARAFQDASSVDEALDPPLESLQGPPERKAAVALCADRARKLRAQAVQGAAGNGGAFSASLREESDCLGLKITDLAPLVQRYCALSPATRGAADARRAPAADAAQEAQQRKARQKAMALARGDLFDNRLPGDYAGAGPSSFANKETGSTGAGAAPLKASDFQLHGRFFTGGVPLPGLAAARRPTIDVRAASIALMKACGGPGDALAYVAGVRDNENALDVRRERLANIERITGVKFQDPESSSGRGDDDLRDIDHYLTAWNGAARFIPPDKNDSEAAASRKVAAREYMAAGTSVVVAGYELLKSNGESWVEKNGGDFFGLIKSDTSKASWNETWQGFSGAWAGAFERTDFSPPPGTDPAAQVSCRLGANPVARPTKL